MDSLRLENLIHSLKTDSALQAKKNIYLQIQTYLKKQEKGGIISEELLAAIQSHLKEHELVTEALTTWILYARIFKYLPEGIVQVVYNIYKNLDLMFPLFCELLNEDSLNIEQILSNTDFMMNKEVIDQLYKASEKVSYKRYLEFINGNIVNIIFITKNDKIRDVLIDFVLSKDLFSISHCTVDEQRNIANLFKKKYIKVVTDLRIQNNKNWYHLCIFTVKYCGKLLHSDIELMNMILHNVEIGFKTKTIQDRLMSYDCWKEFNYIQGQIDYGPGGQVSWEDNFACTQINLVFINFTGPRDVSSPWAQNILGQVLIDVCNLDHTYISSVKQLRLLIKPLKVKLSKNEEVTQKRFEIWFYLVKVLQEKLVNCLDQFLRFCFELTDEDVVSDIIIDSDVIRKTWFERAEILIAVIGHCENDCKCLEIQNFTFRVPIVMTSNILEYDSLLLNAIYTSCKMISRWDDGTKNTTKVKCLWKSIFQLIQGLPEDSKEGVLRKISKIFYHILCDCSTNQKYFLDILVPIFSVLSSLPETVCSLLYLNEIFIFPIIQFSLSQQLLDHSWSKEVINVIQNTSKVENKLLYFKHLCELLKAANVNSNFLPHFWLYSAEELYGICKMQRNDFGDFKEDGIFFLTRIFTSRNCEETEKCIPVWTKIFTELCLLSEDFVQDLLKTFGGIIRTYPDTGANILIALSNISKLLLDTKTWKRNAMDLLNILFECLQNPCTPKNKVLLTLPILKKVLSLYTSGDNIEVTSIILRIYDCIQYLLKPHQVFEVLAVFKEVVPKFTNNMKKKLPVTLTQTLNELALFSDALISQDAIDLLAQTNVDDKPKKSLPFVRPSISSRTVKIANMAKDNSCIFQPKDSTPKVFASTLKTHLSNTSISRNSRIKRIKELLPRISTIDENDIYIPVNTTVRLDKSKLSTHQKEMLNKSSESIPALYQDLSHSQQSSIDTSNDCSSTINHKTDLSVNDNFQDIISDLKKKNSILQERCEAALNDSFEATVVKLEHNDKSALNSIIGDFIDIPSNKDDQGTSNFDEKFERSSETNIRTVNDNIENNTNIRHEQVRSKTALCSLKFEENLVAEPAEKLILADYNHDDFSLTCMNSLRKKHTRFFIKNTPIRNRRMSDSHIVLKKVSSSDSMCDFTNVDGLSEDTEVSLKCSKPKTKEFKSKLREKHKQHLVPTDCDDLESKTNLQLRKRCRSLDNLNDIMQQFDVKKVKKCFKIIQSDGNVGNSIKLRIAITDEKDNTSDIIEQLDTEISKIDANLQNNFSLLHKNNSFASNLTSSDVFSSEDQYLDSEILDNECKHEKALVVNNTISQTLQHIDCVRESCVMKTEKCKENNLEKRKKRELDRIKMDIVGAEQFTVTTPRRRKTSKLYFKTDCLSTDNTSIDKSDSILVCTSENIFQGENNEKGHHVNSSRKHKKRKLLALNSVSDSEQSQSKVNINNTYDESKQEIHGENEIKIEVSKEFDPESEQEIESTPVKRSSKAVKGSQGKSINAGANLHCWSKKKSLKNKHSLTPLEDKPESTNKKLRGTEECNRTSTRLRKKILNLRTDGLQLQEENEPLQILESSVNLSNSSSHIVLPLASSTKYKKTTNNQSHTVFNDSTEHEMVVKNPDECNDTHRFQENQYGMSTTAKLHTQAAIHLLELDSLGITHVDEISLKCETTGTLCTSTLEYGVTNRETCTTKREEISNQKSNFSSPQEKPDIFCVKFLSSNNYKDHNKINANNETVVNGNNCDQHEHLLENLKQNTCTADETQTCNPFVNIGNEDDVMEKLEKHGPGAVKTVIKDLNFESLPFAFGTTMNENIQCSPILDDTPNKNKAFMDSTLDISPIKLEFGQSKTSEKNTPVKSEIPDFKQQSSQSAILLDILPGCTNAILQNTPLRKNTQTEMSSTQRIHKIISNCGKLHSIPSEKRDDKVEDVNFVLAIDSVTNTDHDILEFTRELPSPLATPNSSILKKRKFSEVIDDNAFPHIKRRKRVNFSDPPITSEKIYFMDTFEKGVTFSLQSGASETATSIAKVESIPIYPNLASCAIDICNVVTLLNEDLHEYFLSANIKTVADLAVLNEGQIVQLEFLREPRLKRIIEALDIIYSTHTQNEKLITENDNFPIYPELIDCFHPIQNILKFLGDIKTGRDFRSKNIRTIGDLAKLTKPEVLQLSIKLSTMLNALQKYHKKLNKSKKLALQMKEEMMNTDNDFDSYVVNKEENKSINENVVKSIFHETKRVNEMVLSRRTVDEEIKYISEMYNNDEKLVIYNYLKDLLFAP